MRLFSKIFEIYQRVPPCIFFWNFRFVENVEWAWMAFFEFFGILRLKKYFFFEKKNSKIIFLKNFFFPNFYNSCSLNIFEPKIWRRLGTFPSCSTCIYFLANSHAESWLFWDWNHLNVVQEPLEGWCLDKAKTWDSITAKRRFSNKHHMAYFTPSIFQLHCTQWCPYQLSTFKKGLFRIKSNRFFKLACH